MSDAPPPPPPSFGPPPTAPPFATTPVYYRLGGIGRAMAILLVLFAVAGALGSVFSITSRGDARDYVAGLISEDDFLEAISPSVLLDLVRGLVTIALAVLTMIWMFRLARNQQALGRPGRWKPGWAIGGWFLPPVLYIIPMLMMRELWKGADPTPPRAGDHWRTSPEGPLVWAWWIFYGVVPVMLIPFGVSAVSGFGSDSVDLARLIDERFEFTLVSNAAGIVAAILYLFLVKQLTARQAELTGAT